MSKILIFFVVLCFLSCAGMTNQQQAVLAELAGIAIGMAVEVLVDRAGVPDARYGIREGDGEALLYPGWMFFAENGVITEVKEK